MKTRLFFILASTAALFTTNVNASNTQKTEFKPVTNIAAEIKADIASNIKEDGVTENFTYLGETTVKITATESKAITLNLGEIKSEEVTITIEDNSGNKLFTEKVKNTPSFVKKYNVSNLESGNYNLIVAKKVIKSTQPFSIKGGKLYLSTLEKKDKFIPVLTSKGDKLDVNVLLGNYSNITIALYDNEGRKVYEDKNYVVLDLHKRYDLSKIPNGILVAEVTAGDDTYYYTVER